MHYLLTHNVEHTCQRSPQRVAFRFNDEQLDYAQLDTRSSQLAHQLIEIGIKKGDRVAIFMHKNLDLPVAIYGVMKAGAAYVPIDPLAPSERISFILNDCQVSCLITQQEKQQVFDDLRISATPLKFIIGPDASDANLQSISWDQVRESPAAVKGRNINDTDLAYIIFTSGSTGKPKGIMHSHSSALSYAQLSAHTYDVCAEDVLSNFSSLHFDMSTMDYLTTTYAGASAVIISEAYTKMPASLSALMEKEAITIWYSVPFALIQLLHHGLLEQRNLQSLRWVLYGGEPFAPKHLRKLMDLWPHARFSNVYGPAEVNQCTYYHLPADFSGEDDSVPIGKTWCNTTAVLLDNENQPIDGTDEQGELAVKAPTMMRGYWNNSELNDRCYFDLEIFPGITDRYYRTGDIASVNDQQQLVLHGRKDRQIKFRGYRIELDEIESVFCRHPGVKQCAVYVVDACQDSAGTLDISIEAMLTVHENMTVDVKQLHRHAHGALPAYARPGQILITEQFPLTTSGKIDRKKLAVSAADRLRRQTA